MSHVAQTPGSEVSSEPELPQGDNESSVEMIGKGSLFCSLFQMAFSPKGQLAESFIRTSALMACPPQVIPVGEGVLQKIRTKFWKRMKIQFAKKLRVI